MRKNSIKKQRLISLFIVLVLLCLFLLTMGFSAFQTGMEVSDISAAIRIQRDIRIQAFTLASTSANGKSNWQEYYTSIASTSISLPNSDSTITYNVKVANIGNMEASLSDILGLPSNLTYTLNNYQLKDMMCDDNDNTKCKLGSITTISFTIGYAPNGFDSSNTDYTFDLDFTFSYMVDSIAMIGNTLYDSLQKAVDAVPNDNTETRIILLNNTSEVVTISNNKHITLDLNNKTLSNNGNNNVIKNNGTLNISNGLIKSSAATNGAVNNEATGIITISSGRIEVTGGRQALYNNNGIATITGSAYLSSSATARAAVQNLANGTLNILGGVINSTGSNGVQNAGTLSIGIKDGNINQSIPIIQGTDYGLTTTVNVNFYDGILKGANASINSATKLVNLEDGYIVVNDEETIDNVVYKVSYPGIANKVTFNGNGGTVKDGIKYIITGKKVGALPLTYRTGYELIGWYTERNGGSEIDSNTIINEEITFYAHWNRITDVVRIGNTYYDTVQEAINATSDNTQTTITFLKNISEQLTIANTKNIIFDLNNKTLSNLGNSSVVENSGITTFTNGTISSNADVGAINNNAGRLIVSTDARIVATGSRQAIYIVGGIVEITENAYLSSQTSGTPTNSQIERGTIQCLTNGTLIITGGTIEGLKQQAVSNEGNLTIGTKDGNINITTPVLIGNAHGVRSKGTFNFYDGIIKGKTDAINGTISEQEVNSQLVNDTETIDGSTYNTAYLENIE